MKQSIHRRLLSWILAAVMVLGLLPAGLAVGTTDEGITALNEAFEPRESLAPKGTAFTIDELLAWTPESDPDAAYSRASIPLADRKGGFHHHCASFHRNPLRILGIFGTALDVIRNLGILCRIQPRCF